MGARVDIGADEVVLWHVDTNATGADDGSSWTNAFDDLQEALDTAEYGDGIWVAEGTYYPDSDDPNNRELSFELVEGAGVYGGFDANDILFEDRDWVNNQTILSADINVPNDANDNSYHVVVGTDAAILDGFIITGGKADGADANEDGGGIYCNQNGFFTIRHCVINDNEAKADGGGIYCQDSDITISNCLFAENEADDGGGIYDFNSSPILINCTFSQNDANYGGGMYNYGSLCEPNVSNCIFWGNNSVTDGNEIYNAASADPNFSYCDIVGSGGSSTWDPNFGNDDGGNIDSDPCFVDINSPAGGDGLLLTLDDGLRLYTNSPCIDAADGDDAPDTDILHFGRIDISYVDNTGRGDPNYADIGAYESYGSVTKVWYVNADVQGGNDDGTTWADAFDDMQEALTNPALAAGDEIWVVAASSPYVPGMQRSDSFVLVSDVAVYGGFDGTETVREERNWSTNMTILSGDIDADDVGNMPDNGNSYHVVVGATGAVLDGFTITGGHADNYAGAGGGGMYCDNASPTVNNCIFTRNVAQGIRSGGGLYSSNGSSPILVNCVLGGNLATGNKGGAVYHCGDTLTLTNCTIANNSGDGIHCDSATVTMQNCIVWQNRTKPDDPGYPVREICLFNNAQATISYCNVEGGQGAIILEPSGVPVLNWGDGNITSEPQIKRWGIWDWRLKDGTDLQAGSTTIYTPLEGNPDEIIIYDLSRNFADMEKGNTNHDEDDFIADLLVNKKPVWVNNPSDTSTLSNEANFNLWFNDDPNGAKRGPVNTNYRLPWVCQDDQKGIFRFNSDHFFPIDNCCYDCSDPSCGCTEPECFGIETHPKLGCSYSGCPGQHNWFFTLQYHTQMTYVPGETLVFKASDDLFLAINDTVIVKRGGYFVDCASETHVAFDPNGDVTVYKYGCGDPPVLLGSQTYSFGLTPDSAYDFDLFFAQRHSPYSVLIVDRSLSPGEMLPFFIAGDYELEVGSSGNDAGDNFAVPVDITLDCSAGSRFTDDLAVVDAGNGTAPIVDMGAYEFKPVPVDAGPDQKIFLPVDTVSLDGTVTGVFDSVEWSYNGPSGDVTFADPFSLQTTATFASVGTYDLSLTAKNSEGLVVGLDTVQIEVLCALVVDAGPNLIVEAPEVVANLNGAVSCGDTGAIVIQWSMVSGPAGCSVQFADPSQAVTTATFECGGVYQLKLSASDGYINVEDTITVTVFPPPVVDAGPDQEIVLPDTALLNGSVEGAYVSTEWRYEGTPGLVTFTDPYALQTTATFTSEDTYELDLVAKNSEGTIIAYDTVVITVYPALFVDAGTDQTITLPTVMANLDGTVTGGKPGTVTTSWSIYYGPYDGTVAFGDSSQTDTTATFATGIKWFYKLKLTATDGTTTIDDTVKITVEPDYTPVVVEAGANQDITLPTNSVTLNGSIIEGTPDSTRWVVDSRPYGGTVTFSDLSSLTSTATFADGVSGDYWLKLEALDNTPQVVGDDTVLIKIHPETINQAPTPMAGVYPAITLPANQVNLSGTIEDDGLPEGAGVTTVWEVINRPTGATVSIDDPLSLITTATFSQKGPYVLQLKAFDGELWGYSSTNIMVNPGNQAPVVKAGTNHEITLSAEGNGQVNLDSAAGISVQDDGLPNPPGALTTKWRPLTGPVAGMMFDDVSSVYTVARFTKDGEYTLELEAFDDEKYHRDICLVKVNPEPGSESPEVEAGANKSEVLPAAGGVDVYFVDAYAIEHALPHGDMTLVWELAVDSPSTTGINFNGQDNVEKPTFTFTATGLYKLVLTASDDGGQYENSDTVWVSIVDPAPVNLVNVLYAGANGGTMADKVYSLKDGDTQWREVSQDLGDAVYCLCEYNGEIYAGTGDSGSGIGRVWRKNGVNWDIVGDNLDDVVFSLAVYDGQLYAGIGYGSAKLYRYDGGTSWTKVASTLNWAGFRCMYVFNELLYLGDAYDDQFGHFDGTTFTHDSEFYGSCVYDLQYYDGYLYGGAWSGKLYHTSNGSDWSVDNWNGNYDLLELEAFQNALYISNGNALVKYDGSSHENAPGYSVSDAIISMVAAEDALYIGTGTEAGPFANSWGNDGIYRYDGTSNQLISSGLDMGSGVQSLLQTKTLPSPSNFTMTLTATLIEGGGCLSPIEETKDEIEYQICYDSAGQLDAVNVRIIDYLTSDVDFVSASGQGVYDSEYRRVTWYLGDLSDTDTGCFTVRVKVNNYARPLAEIVNYCEIKSNNFELSAEDRTPAVCCWTENDYTESKRILYVDDDSPGYSGSSWETALRSLADALEIAETCGNIDEIWVAAGSYNPSSPSADPTFQMLSNVDIYGGFTGAETQIGQRDFKNPENQSILTGFGAGALSYVVTGVDNAILDGFTIAGGKEAGVLCDGTSPAISNCIIEYNEKYGIECKASSSATITRSKIRYNQQHGIYCYQTNTPEITNNWVCDNGTSSSYRGIYLYYCDGTTMIRNNTIANNYGYGVCRAGGSGYPDIQNCIVYGNYSVSTQISPSTLNVSYSCIQNGYPNGSNIISDAPGFVDADSGDYHLKEPDSPCIINPGDPSLDYSGETDIDGEPREIGTGADRGADEYPPVKVYAGSDREITLSSNPFYMQVDDASVMYNGTVDPPSNPNFEWTQLSGPSVPPGSDRFVDETVVKTTVNFYEYGTYVFKLEAFEGTTQIGWDTIQVKANLGVDAFSNNEVITLPADSVQLDAVFTGGDSGRLYWYGLDGSVSFSSSNPLSDPQVTATFNDGPGIYEMLLIAADASDNIIGWDSVYVAVQHQQLTVDAGPNQEIILPDDIVELHGTVSGGAPYATAWVLVEAPGPVYGGDPFQLDTWAQFTEPGEYILGLLALDYDFTIISADMVTVTVYPGERSQLVVDAGTDQEVDKPATGNAIVMLSGLVTGGSHDDVEWIDPSGAYITFTPSDKLDTVASISQSGIYEIALVVKNSGVIVGVDTVTVTVNYPRLKVDAGPDREIFLPNDFVDLKGTVTGGSYSSVEWLNPAPDYVTIFPPFTLETGATFAAAGSYEIGLVAKDVSDNVIGYDTVIIKVNATPVKVDAGVDKEITMPEDEVVLHGHVIYGEPDSTQWQYYGQAGLVTFGNASALDTWVEFAEPGVYQLFLEARDDQDNIIHWDIVTVVVSPEVATATVTATSDPPVITLPTETTVQLQGNITGTYDSQEWIFAGPSGLVSIASPDLLTSNATFTEPGVYEIGLLAKNNSEVVGLEVTTVIVNLPDYRQVKVDAGQDEEITMPASGPVSTVLSGSITGNYDSVEWIDPSGGNVQFTPDNMTLENVTAEFSQPGIYEIPLLAKDDSSGQIIGYDTVVITVNPNGYSVLDVEAGTDQVITLPATASLEATVEGGVFGVDYDEVEWIDPSGELNYVIFTPSDQLSTTAAFVQAGIYHISVVVKYQGTIVGGGNVVVTVNPPDQQQRIVEIIADSYEITLPDNSVALTATVRGGPYNSLEWIDPSGGLVEFEPSDQLATAAMFAEAGIFQLGLLVKDSLGYVIGIGTVEITVNNPNLVVDAGVDKQVILTTVPVSVPLNGSVTGLLPLPSQTTEWVFTSGPAELVTFVDAANLTTDAQFTQAGRYDLKLQVKNISNEVIAWDIVTITVNLPNQGPVVHAGSDKWAVISGAEAAVELLDAYVFDDGWEVDENGQIVYPATLTVNWSSIPDTGVTFDDSEQINTTVRFAVTGTYDLTLEATDGGSLIGSDTVRFYVDTENRAPLVEAGANKEITLPNNRLYLGDARVVAGTRGPVTTQWHFNGPEELVKFDDPSVVKTWVTLGSVSEPHDYELALLATDLGGTVVDTLWVTVNPDNPSQIIVDAGDYSDVTLTDKYVMVPLDNASVSNAPSYDVQWSVADGPVIGPVTFIESNAELQPTAKFTVPGMYLLRIEVTDETTGAPLGEDSTWIAVHKALEQQYYAGSMPYQTSFEPSQDFVAGFDLDYQDGWQVDSSTAIAESRIWSESNARGQTGWFREHYLKLEPDAVVSKQLNNNSGNGHDGEYLRFHIRPALGASIDILNGSAVIANIEFNADSYIYTNGTQTSADWTSLTSHFGSLRIEADYGTNKFDVYWLDLLVDPGVDFRDGAADTTTEVEFGAGSSASFEINRFSATDYDEDGPVGYMDITSPSGCAQVVYEGRIPVKGEMWWSRLGSYELKFNPKTSSPYDPYDWYWFDKGTNVVQGNEGLLGYWNLSSLPGGNYDLVLAPYADKYYYDFVSDGWKQIPYRRNNIPTGKVLDDVSVSSNQLAPGLVLEGTDLSVPWPGQFPFEVKRRFNNNSRFHKKPLPNGWSHNNQVSLIEIAGNCNYAEDNGIADRDENGLGIGQIWITCPDGTVRGYEPTPWNYCEGCSMVYYYPIDKDLYGGDVVMRTTSGYDDNWELYTFHVDRIEYVLILRDGTTIELTARYFENQFDPAVRDEIKCDIRETVPGAVGWKAIAGAETISDRFDNTLELTWYTSNGKPTAVRDVAYNPTGGDIKKIHFELDGSNEYYEEGSLVVNDDFGNPERTVKYSWGDAIVYSDWGKAFDVDTEGLLVDPDGSLSNQTIDLQTYYYDKGINLVQVYRDNDPAIEVEYDDRGGLSKRLDYVAWDSSIPDYIRKETRLTYNYDPDDLVMPPELSGIMPSHDLETVHRETIMESWDKDAINPYRTITIWTDDDGNLIYSKTVTEDALLPNSKYAEYASTDPYASNKPTTAWEFFDIQAGGSSRIRKTVNEYIGYGDIGEQYVYEWDKSVPTLTLHADTELAYHPTYGLLTDRAGYRTLDSVNPDNSSGLTEKINIYGHSDGTYDAVTGSDDKYLVEEKVLLDEGTSGYAATSYKYLSSGLINEKTDPKTNRTKYEYDNNGYKTFEKVGAVGSEIIVKRFHYDSIGQLILEANRHGGVTLNYYDDFSRLYEVRRFDDPGALTRPDAEFVQSTYEAMTAVATMKYGYDALGNRTYERKPDYGQATVGEITTIYTISSLSKKVTYGPSTCTDCSYVEYSYDDRGLKTSERHFDNTATPASDEEDWQITYDYDDLSRPTETVRFDYDESAVVKKSTSEYYGTGKKKSDGLYGVGGILEKQTDYEYDILGRMIKSIVDPAGLELTTEYAYDGAGNMLYKIAPEGNIQGSDQGNYIFYDYDSAKRETVEYFAESYNASINDTKANAIARKETQYYHNNLAKNVTCDDYDHDDSGSSDGQLAYAEFVYDQQNRLIEVTQDKAAEGDRAVTTYYAYSDETDFGTEFEQYDIRITDGKPKNTYIALDKFGTRIKTLYPSGDYAELEYNGDGTVKKRAVWDRNDAQGTPPQWIQYSYDKYGRVDIITYPGTTGTVNYDFDDFGRKTQVTDSRAAVDNIGGNSQISYLYDVLGRTESITDQDDYDIDYTYKADGQKESIKVYDNTPSLIYDIKYAYDMASRLNTVDEPLLGTDDLIAGLEYDDNGNRSQLSYSRDGTSGSTVDISYSYNLDDLLARFTTTGGPSFTFGGTVGPASDWAKVDGLGRLIDASETLTKTDQVSITHSLAYTYDMLSRLTSAITTNVYTGTYPDLEYSSLVYDDAGNLTNLTYKKDSDNQTTSYTFDGDFLTGDGTDSVDWDENGRQISQLSTTPTDDYFLEYSWDGRLRKAQAGSGDRTLEATYMPDGIRIAKKRTWDDASGYNHKYIVDTAGKLPAILMILDADSSNAILKTFVHANGQIIMQHAGGHTASKYFYLHDRLGSVRQVFDPTDTTVKNCYTYDSWGLPVGDETLENIFNPYLFAGYLWDAGIRQYYCNARMYDPVLGRFTSRDLVKGNFEEPLSLHVYLYCENDPLNNRDLNGLWKDGIRYALREGGASDAYSLSDREIKAQYSEIWDDPSIWHGHSDFGYLLGDFDYTTLDHQILTRPENILTGTSRHFRTLGGPFGAEFYAGLALRSGDVEFFQEVMHMGQDYFSHRGKGYGPVGHLWADITGNPPDNPYSSGKQLSSAYKNAQRWTKQKEELWYLIWDTDTWWSL